MADQNPKLYELKHGASDSSEGAWAILSRRLQAVAGMHAIVLQWDIAHQICYSLLTWKRNLTRDV
jgi:hypothetical protein